MVDHLVSSVYNRSIKFVSFSMNTENTILTGSIDDFIPVETLEEGVNQVEEVEHIDGGEKPYSLFQKPAVPTHVSEGMQQMQKDAQQLQQEQQSVEHIDGGEKRYSLFQKPGEKEAVPTHISEGMQQIQEDAEQILQDNERKQKNAAMIEILRKEPKFEGAFKDLNFSDGSTAIVFERGMFELGKKQLDSNLGISEKYSTPKNINDVISEKHSVIMLSNEGMIFLVTGGVYNRNAQEYEAIYKMVMSKKESSGNTEEFQTTFSNKELFPNQGFSDEGAELDAEGNVVSRAVDSNFYWAMYMKDNLNDKKYGFDTKALLKEFAEASVLTKEEEEKKRQTSPEELKAMIAEIN